MHFGDAQDASAVARIVRISLRDGEEVELEDMPAEEAGGVEVLLAACVEEGASLPFASFAEACAALLPHHASNPPEPMLVRGYKRRAGAERRGYAPGTVEQGPGSSPLEDDSLLDPVAAGREDNHSHDSRQGSQDSAPSWGGRHVWVLRGRGGRLLGALFLGPAFAGGRSPVCSMTIVTALGERRRGVGGVLARAAASIAGSAGFETLLAPLVFVSNTPAVIIWKENSIKTFLAMKFTTRHVLY